MMDKWLEPKTRSWAIATVLGGIGLSLGGQLIAEPAISPGHLLIELVEILLIVSISAAVVLLLQAAYRRRDDRAKLRHDLAVARIRGERWRSDVRTHLNGLGQAVDRQFSSWGLSEAEREVGHLLKGLSYEEIAAIRTSSERTVRRQARALYAKARLTGRAAFLAFFLEDLTIPSCEPDDRQRVTS